MKRTTLAISSLTKNIPSFSGKAISWLDTRETRCIQCMPKEALSYCYSLQILLYFKNLFFLGSLKSRPSEFCHEMCLMKTISLNNPDFARSELPIFNIQ